jgi:hypothetical protein
MLIRGVCRVGILCVLCRKCMKGLHIRLVMSVHMMELEDNWTDLDEIWYGDCTIWDYLKILLCKFKPTVVTKWLRKELARWGQHYQDMK